MTLDAVNFWLAIAGTVAFAVTAVLAIADRGVDIFGVIVLGVITAVGGGTVRDMILGVPVFWASDLLFVRVAVLSSILAFVARKWFTLPQIYTLMIYTDGLGAALFGMNGALKCWELDFAWPLGPVILGVITAIGGGIIRDVIVGRKTLIMSTEVYAVPVTLGCVLMMLLLYFFPDDKGQVLIASTLFSFCMRAAAIRWNWQMPAFLVTKSR
jgi:uncharacterized membrane protein YeiH